MKNIFNGKIKYLLSSLLFIFIFFISISNIQTGFACSTGYEPDCGDTYNSSCPAGTVPSADGWSCVSSASSSCPAGTTYDSNTWTCVYNPNPYIPPVYQPVVYNQPSYNYPVYQQQQSYSYYTQQQQQPQMFQCWNGTYVYNQSQCPAQTQTCPNGQVISINQACPPQTQTCWNGTVISINQACPPQFHICPNGQSLPMTQVCPAQTHTCWNGVTISVSQSCPSQYQTCWDGSVISVGAMCPVKTITNVVVKTVTITSHSVLTNIPTKVSQTSAECNGVGLISSGVGSVGWFEFGTSESLGKVTNSADIGNNSQSFYSNVISGLKASTTYYCRAVMANRDGTYRGKIVSFKTLAATKSHVVYASPSTVVKVKPKTKTEFVCSDGSIAVAKTVSIADTINAGGKLLSIKIERNSPDLVQGSTINYRISITNDSDTAVSGAETKIVLPSEIIFLDATTTAGVIVKDNVMTVPIGNINSKEVKTFILPAKVSNTAEIGKAVVTTVYASYNLPVSGSKIVKDEVSAYMTANIVASSGSKDTVAKSSSVAAMLFPQSLLGWLVLFAVILIIVVLIMNIRRWIAERKLEKEETIHHHRS